MKHPPRKGDLPREELMKTAMDVIAGGEGIQVFFKFTCEHCGERCLFNEPNMLYEYGECHACGRSTIVEYGGFMVDITLNKAKE